MTKKEIHQNQRGRQIQQDSQTESSLNAHPALAPASSDNAADQVPRGLAAPLSLPGDIDLLAYLRVIWRRKIWLFATVIIVTGLSIVVALQLTNQYTATAFLAIKTQSEQVVQLGDVTPSIRADTATMETQVKVLTSSTLASKIIERLGLTDDSEFNPALRPEDTGLLTYMNPGQYIPDEWIDIARDWIVALRGSPDRPKLSEPVRAQQSKGRLVKRYLANLTVKTEGNSYVLSVAYRSEDPSKAALIANTMVDTYLVEQVKTKAAAAQRATKFLTDRIVKLRKDLQEAEARVETYRKVAGLTEGKGITSTDQQFSELNYRLVIAQTERENVEARFRELEYLLKSPNGLDSAQEVLTHPLIINLKEQEALALRKVAELRNTYRDKHPKIVNARTELQDIREKIDLEIKMVVQSVGGEVRVARTREEVLRQSVANVQKKLAGLNNAEVKLRELEREASASRTIYETFLARVKETSQQEELQQPDAEIISRASVPIAPSYPQRRIIAALALVGSIAIGLGIVFGIEGLDRGFRSTEQIESLTGLRVLGLVPTIRGFGRSLSGIRLLKQNDLGFEEAIRRLAMEITMLSEQKSAKVILITSALPDEGKSTLAAAMALEIARSGKLCVLVDCDFRRSQLQKVLEVRNSVGLAELLYRKAPVEEVLQKNGETGLHLITCGRLLQDCLSSSEENDVKAILPVILGSKEMREVLGDLAQRYDSVILDAPPAMLVSEALVLARLADRTIYAIQWAKTRQNIALEGIRELINGGANLAGFVLTKVNVKKYDQYGFSRSGLYGKKYFQYY